MQTKTLQLQDHISQGDSADKSKTCGQAKKAVKTDLEKVTSI